MYDKNAAVCNRKPYKNNGNNTIASNRKKDEEKNNRKQIDNVIYFPRRYILNIEPYISIWTLNRLNSQK